MQDEKPEQSALLWKKSSGISGKCSAAVCARILYFNLRREIRWYHITETAWKNDARRKKRGPKKNWD